MSINKWMDKQILVYSQNGILLSNKSNKLPTHGQIAWMISWASRVHTIGFHSYEALQWAMLTYGRRNHKGYLGVGWREIPRKVTRKNFLGWGKCPLSRFWWQVHRCIQLSKLTELITKDLCTWLYIKSTSVKKKKIEKQWTRGSVIYKVLKLFSCFPLGHLTDTGQVI